jgi:Putative 8-oxoguanine DNA glycosylase OGG-like protein
VGYGPFQVRGVPDAVPNAGARLHAAAGIAVEGQPVDGYACLGDHGIARLPTSSQPALILDRLVARWLRENAGLPLGELWWSVSTYVRYLEIMFGWADELALAAGELELCIFSTQAGGLGDSQWAPG